MEANTPVRFTDKKAYVATLFQNQLTKYALQSQVSEENVLTVFVKHGFDHRQKSRHEMLALCCFAVQLWVFLVWTLHITNHGKL